MTINSGIFIQTFNEFDYYLGYLKNSLNIVNNWITNSHNGLELLELFDYIYDFMLIDNRYKDKYYTYSFDKKFPFLQKKTQINQKTFESFINTRRPDYEYPYYLKLAKDRLDLLETIFSNNPKNIFLCAEDLLLILTPQIWKERQRESFRKREIPSFLLYIKYGS